MGQDLTVFYPYFKFSKKKICAFIERYDERLRARSDITAKPRSYVGELKFPTGKGIALRE